MKPIESDIKLNETIQVTSKTKKDIQIEIDEHP